MNAWEESNIDTPGMVLGAFTPLGFVLFCFVSFNLQEQRCKINTRALALKIRRPRIQEMKYFGSHNKNGQWAASLGSDRVPSACGF